MKLVKHLLHEMFSEDAIMAAAIFGQDDDIRYCTEHGFTTEDFVARDKKAAEHYEQDSKRTYNSENIKAFQERADELLRKNRGTPGDCLYTETNEIEEYAIMCLYYQGRSW